MRGSINWKPAALAALLALLVQGCTVGPHYHAPVPPTVAGYTPQPQQTAGSPGPAGVVQHFNSSAEIPAEWWTLFRSPELNAMVSKALENSPTLTQATARLRQAQEELAARTGQTKYPTVTGTASIQQEQPNLSAYGIPFPNPSPFTLLNGTIGISYALDIFGANRHLIEGLRAQREYQQWQYEGARLILAGNVVTAAIAEAQFEQQLDLTRQMLELQRRELAISIERNRAGGVSEYALRTQQTAVAQSEAKLPPLLQQLDAIHDELALLMGESPAETHVAHIPLESLTLPAELPLSLPSSLVKHRPDIRAAEALLHQASASAGVATANQFPQVLLSASAGGIGTSFLNGGALWNVGSSLTQPIFNGGALQAEKRKALAAYDEANGVYRQTVLEAFHQVADALYATQHDAETLEACTGAASQADAAWQIAGRRYSAGGISDFDLLEAQRQNLRAAQDCTQPAASRLQDSATLIQALGAGWWNESPVSTSGNNPLAEPEKRGRRGVSGPLQTK
jgi:NodT family efflux transporter outer membrane factor (OMF) lipoprotein